MVNKTCKSNEEKVIDCFDNNQTLCLTQKMLNKKLSFKQINNYINDLIYGEYIVDNGNGKYQRTSKMYNIQNRNNEKKQQKKQISYKYLLNKVFTGSYLTHNLAHDLINFLIADNKCRYIYINPLGKCKNNVKYVFHLLESPVKTQKGVYEVVGVSVVDDSSVTTTPTYQNYSYNDIFSTQKAKTYSFVANDFFVPKKDKRILLKINSTSSSLTISGNNVITAQVIANPKRSIAYAKNKFKSLTKMCSPTDEDVLEKIMKKHMTNQLSNSVIYKNVANEQPFSVICGRVNLENSMSNQIAYFLGRDKGLCYSFLTNLLKINTISPNEVFEIRREEHDIDLLFISKNHVIVIENKIDSDINGVKKGISPNPSQLSKYYTYIDKKYKKITNHAFFILAPEYNTAVAPNYLNSFLNGNNYTIKTYREFANFLSKCRYSPLGKEITQEQRFMFNQFILNVQYLGWSKAQQRENTAYIRLKQRIEELSAQSNNTYNKNKTHP